MTPEDHALTDRTHEAAKTGSASAGGGKVTPMMAQYLEIKAAHPDVLLFYRMGDFYELFFEDAVQAAEALDIALTKRGKHLGEDIPMCGVPVHSHDTYLSRLIRKGFRVGVCEQLEDPAEAKKRGSKAVVKRDVVRVITPGTLTEDTLLESRANNYLAAVAQIKSEPLLGLAWLDLSTGSFRCEAIDPLALATTLARVQPGELLVPDGLLEEPLFYDIWAEWKAQLTPLPAARFESRSSEDRLKTAYHVTALDAFGSLSRGEISAAGAVLAYVELTQKGLAPRLAPLKQITPATSLEIDAATRRNLELAAAQGGGKSGALLHVLDETVTGPGARLLAARLSAPLTNPSAISERLESVRYFYDDSTLRRNLREALRSCADMERALGRMSLGRGGPRDLKAVATTLAQSPEVRTLITAPHAAGIIPPPDELIQAAADLGHHDTLVDRLDRALVDEPPLLARDGGFVAEGYLAALDEQRVLRDQSRKLIAALEQKYQGLTSVGALKVRHNNVLGYYVEVPSKHGDGLMGVEPFIHRQTMANAVRFSTTELAELEDQIRAAGEKALALELEVFADLLADVTARAAEIATAAQALAVLDVSQGLAHVAAAEGYVRPLVTDGKDLSIEDGRHPVVDQALRLSGDGSFVANPLMQTSKDRLWLVTGPNMAGKSTFLRQNALIIVMAQMGSFVPASAATIGVVDRLFSRVGAADDLARGRSTFMVEMVETATILNRATDRSFVILDEIGRGTATYDGLSIAWAVLEHLHDRNQCRALFATHYHELTGLAGSLSAVSCHTMRVKEWKDSIVFLHEVIAGTADRSYGLHVAELAGLPPDVIQRAGAILARLEQGDEGKDLAQIAEDLPLFAPTGPALAPSAPHPLEVELDQVQPDLLSPRDALDLIYRLKDLSKDDA